MFLHLVVEVVRYQQVIIPTVAGKAGLVESFAHMADFQIGFQRGGDTGNLLCVGHEQGTDNDVTDGKALIRLTP